MEFYLIRHGETVDNVAGLYAGVRDSALTVHGVEQARRLGEHFATNGVKFTHIFASPLTRAFKTAQAVSRAQPRLDGDTAAVEIVQAPNLIEQNFGYYEGKAFHARSDPKKTGREVHREQHKDEPGFVDVESKESMNKRADVFLDEHVMPLFEKASACEKHVVAIVSHGMLLSHLWRRILRRLPPKTVSINPEVTSARGSIVLEHLGGWSNTGYLELSLSQEGAAVATVTESTETTLDSTSAASSVACGTTEQHASSSTDFTGTITTTTSSRVLSGWSLLIQGIDRKDHLVGLKRQRGGIGRTAHDDKQQKIHSFFKRPRQT